MKSFYMRSKASNLNPNMFISSNTFHYVHYICKKLFKNIHFTKTREKNLNTSHCRGISILIMSNKLIRKISAQFVEWLRCIYTFNSWGVGDMINLISISANLQKRFAKSKLIVNKKSTKGAYPEFSSLNRWTVEE